MNQSRKELKQRVIDLCMKNMNFTIILFFILVILAITFHGHKNPPENGSDKYPVHENITVTIFLVGEVASEDNEFISNEVSAWDEAWLRHYENKTENSFYFALPYNDFDEEGIRKRDAEEIIY